MRLPRVPCRLPHAWRKSPLSLFRFKYLQRKRTVTLIIVLTLVSTLFSITAYSFLGFYNGFSSYVGEEQAIAAVYSKRGSTPFSGVIAVQAATELSSLSGVVAVSPEVLAPCTISDQSVFVRGIIPEEAAQLNPLKIVDGQTLNFTDTNSAIIGEGLAQRFHLKIGDKVLVIGVLSKQYAELNVKGVFTSDSSLNDEALVSLYIGQWLRGISYNQVTLVRIKIDPSQTSINQLYGQISANKTDPSTSPAPAPTSQIQHQLQELLPISQSYLDVSNIDIENSEQFMQNYLNRYGVSKDTLIVLSVIVLAFASGTAVCAISLFIKQHNTDFATLQSIGVSKKQLKRDLATRMSLWALTAILLGTLISAGVLFAFQKLGYLLFLSHSIRFTIDPVVVAANFVLLCTLIAVSIYRMELKQ
jgi:ABC-type lipoprotein release transport system permease subunit